MANVITSGVRRVVVDGVALDLVSVDTCKLTTTKHEVVEVVAGNPGLSAKPQIAELGITVLRRGIRALDYVGAENVKVQIDMMAGNSFVFPAAAETGDGEIDSDNKLKLVYQSATVKEIS